MSKLQLIPVIKPDTNKLSEAYEVAEDIKRKVGTATVVVPRFFQYDGSSVPTAAWPLIGTPFNPHFMRAAVFHDWIYHTHQIAQKNADSLMHDILIEDDVPSTTAWIMYQAVKAVGTSYWKNDPEDNGYIARLTKKIVDDGRDPATYGLPPKP